MKKKEVEIKIIKKYIGGKLISRHKVTTTKWNENGRTYMYSKQDHENFQAILWSSDQLNPERILGKK